MRWQESHDSAVTKWVNGLPRAFDPLWHDAQEPGRTPLWSNNVPVKFTVLWQTLHGCVTGECEVDIVTALTRLPRPWQISQALGVPFKTPRT